MDLDAQHEASLRMPMPMNYSSIHEASKFRMPGGPSITNSTSSSLNGTTTVLHSSVGTPHLLRSTPSVGPSASAPLPAAVSSALPQPIVSHSSSVKLDENPQLLVGTNRASPTIAAASSEHQQAGGSILTARKPVKYRECLKNHAANLGGHALDGCGEFMPSGEEGSLEALKCAACGCHRNFHRREVEGEQHPVGAVPPCNFCAFTPPGALQSIKDESRRRYSPLVAALPPIHPPLALPPPPAAAIPAVGGLPSRPLQVALHSPQDGTAEDESHLHYPTGAHHGTTMQPQHQGAMLHHHNHHHHPANLHFSGHSNAGGAASLKKRFRTKFTSEQKEQMFIFAEKLGWRIQKHDEGAVHQFCADVGVKRHVFKVWMHNNKNTFSKKILPSEGGAAYLDNGGSSPTSSSGNMQS
ncbi:hypothetical protein KP509_30G008700 [Ceratopteris richardii]|uniref:ZF-HD dimerization-type domain-containing protein n=1 Tax=Ceratopteris richardii TaxID=49495 RepID=A0A8T2R1H7_CERRI|nr:hypothetical protein KP509_30G008700 [Ceratopteris richardii]